MGPARRGAGAAASGDRARSARLRGEPPARRLAPRGVDPAGARARRLARCHLVRRGRQLGGRGDRAVRRGPAPLRGGPGRRGRRDGACDAAARRPRRPVGLRHAEPRAGTRADRAHQPRPRRRDAGGRRGALPRDAGAAVVPGAVPAAAPALGRRPRAHARGAREDHRAGPAGARRAGPRGAAARQLPAAAGGAARRPRPRVRILWARLTAGAHRRVQPPDHLVPGDRPMTDFAVLRAPSQVLFGSGMAAAAGDVAAEHGRRVLVITDPVIAQTPGFATVLDSLAALDVTVFAEAAVDVPPSAVDAALAQGESARADVIVAVGGGSVIDLAKVTALQLTHGAPLENYYAVGSVPGPVMPLIALPTTAGTGSEATPVAVVTDPGSDMKIGVASRHLIPRHAICDPLLTVGAPPVVTAHAGIDALSHAVESYLAARQELTPELVLGRPQVGKNLLSDALALTAARHVLDNLAQAVEDGSDVSARSGMLYGSLLAGIAFGNSGVGAAHALQFVIGAATHTSHGLGTGLLLPYVMEYNRPARPEAIAQLSELAGGDAVTEIHALGLRIGLPASLAEIGVERDQLRAMADAAAGIKRLVDNSPRSLDADALEAILDAAWHGDPGRLSSEGLEVSA